MIETPSSVPSSIENNSTTPKFYFNPITNNEVKNTWRCFRQDIVTMDEGDDGLLEDVVADIAEVTNIEAATARLATELGEDDDGIINPPNSGGEEADEVVAAWFKEDEDGSLTGLGFEYTEEAKLHQSEINVGEAMEEMLENIDATSKSLPSLDVGVCRSGQRLNAVQNANGIKSIQHPETTRLSYGTPMAEIKEALYSGATVVVPSQPEIIYSDSFSVAPTVSNGAEQVRVNLTKEVTMKETEKPIQKLDSLQLLKGVEGRVLTIMEAAFPNEGQREAVKSLIRKEFRREMNKINRVQDED